MTTRLLLDFVVSEIRKGGGDSLHLSKRSKKKLIRQIEEVLKAKFLGSKLLSENYGQLGVEVQTYFQFEDFRPRKSQKKT